VCGWQEVSCPWSRVTIPISEFMALTTSSAAVREWVPGDCGKLCGLPTCDWTQVQTCSPLTKLQQDWYTVKNILVLQL